MVERLLGYRYLPQALTAAVVSIGFAVAYL